MDVTIVTVLLSISGLLAGIVIGFYKSKADIADKYVSKDDCQKCSVKVDMANLASDMKEATEDLKRGSRTFTEIKISLAVIAEKLGIKDSIEALRKALINDQDGN